ncbi:trypsin-like serine peptidase [Streptomyces olivoreticuli]
MTAAMVGLLAPDATPADTPPSGRDSVVVEHPEARTAAEQQRIQEYWTPQRMQAAYHSGEAPDPVGKDADELPGQDRSKPNTGAVWGGGKIIQSVGRLFMTSKDGNENGEDRSCTATVVDSPTGTTVVTAAHCLLAFPGWPDDKQAVWDTNVYFAPGYRDGVKPQGGFTVNTTYAARPYHDKRDPGSDVAMLAMNPASDDRTIAAVTGTQKIQFNTPRHIGQFTYNFGYTADSNGKQEPWKTGQLLGYCAGPVTQNTQAPQWNHWGMRCNMDKGSSGGPHLIDFGLTSNTGTVIGVNALGRPTPLDGKFEDAAPLGDTAHQVYLRAQQPPMP